MQTRTKAIATPTVGQGTCPRIHGPERFEHQSCNKFPCPKNIECVADLDVVLVQDGSGSLIWRRGRYYTPRRYNRNFELSKTFMLRLIQKSKMAKKDESGKVNGGVRYGVVVYSFNARVISQITHDAESLKTSIEGMKWPRGGTMTGRALLKAMQLFPLAAGGRRRLQVIVLITDGRASKRAQAKMAAEIVRKEGIRLVVVPVKGAMRDPAAMCEWASKPCAENVINTPKWDMLMSKLDLYLTSLCPTIVDPTAVPTDPT